MSNLRRHSVAPATITTSGNSGYLPNQTQTGNVVVLVDSGIVSGASPSMTVSVYGSMTSGGKLALLYTFAAITATNANLLRQMLSEVFEPYIYVAWAVTGTSVVFTAPDIELLFM